MQTNKFYTNPRMREKNYFPGRNSQMIYAKLQYFSSHCTSFVNCIFNNILEEYFSGYAYVTTLQSPLNRVTFTYVYMTAHKVFLIFFFQTPYKRRLVGKLNKDQISYQTTCIKRCSPFIITFLLQFIPAESRWHYDLKACVMGQIRNMGVNFKMPLQIYVQGEEKLCNLMRKRRDIHVNYLHTYRDVN